ncbi:hypothetical protein M8J77_001689 [Diaphorina citri]|nr:hypothetical protein M8J77_001689 [Diaphorina citri]
MYNLASEFFHLFFYYLSREQRAHDARAITPLDVQRNFLKLCPHMVDRPSMDEVNPCCRGSVDGSVDIDDRCVDTPLCMCDSVTGLWYYLHAYITINTQNAHSEGYTHIYEQE